MKLIQFITLISIILNCSINEGIIKGSKLSEKDINYICSLGLLDKNEEIVLFSSNASHKMSGNFITNKRVATYWQYEKNNSENIINSAFFNSIAWVDVEYIEAWDITSYLTVYLKNGKSFKVYISDKPEKEKVFYNHLMSLINTDPLVYQIQNEEYYIRVKLSFSSDYSIQYKIDQKVNSGKEYIDNFSLNGKAYFDSNENIHKFNGIEYTISFTQKDKGVEVIITDKTTRKYFQLKNNFIPES